jgi:hypothetical protein
VASFGACSIAIGALNDSALKVRCSVRLAVLVVGGSKDRQLVLFGREVKPIVVLAAKLAVTVAAAFSVTAHVDVPVHAPVQPVNCCPLAGVAVSVTGVPCAKDSVQSVGQVIPAGDEPTLPEPLTTTVS